MARVLLDLLKSFVTVARSGSVTRSAARLHVTASALSQQIQRLEGRLGYTLFSRGPRGVELTERGRQLFTEVEPHLTALAAIVEPSLRASVTRPLLVTAMESIIASWLLPRLQSFIHQHAEIEVQLVASQKYEDVTVGQWDAALWYRDGAWSSATSEPLMHDWLAPVAAPSMLRKCHWERGCALSKLPLIGPSTVWKPWFVAYPTDSPERYTASLSEAETRLRAAVDGVGVTLSRLSLILPAMKSGAVVALSRHLLKDPRMHYLAYPERSRKMAEFQAFRHWVLAEGAHFDATAPKKFLELWRRQSTAAPLRRSRGRHRG